jgi:hypothetical protein
MSQHLSALGNPFIGLLNRQGLGDVIFCGFENLVCSNPILRTSKEFHVSRMARFMKGSAGIVTALGIEGLPRTLMICTPQLFASSMRID